MTIRDLKAEQRNRYKEVPGGIGLHPDELPAGINPIADMTEAERAAEATRLLDKLDAKKLEYEDLKSKIMTFDYLQESDLNEEWYSW